MKCLKYVLIWAGYEVPVNNLGSVVIVLFLSQLLFLLYFKMVTAQIPEPDMKINFGLPFKAYVIQSFMVLITCLGSFVAGCGIGWVSPALQHLRSPDSPIKLTSDDEAKLAIYPEIGHFIIPMIAGYTADKMGRKSVFIICTLLALAGWGIKYFTSSLSMLLLARLLLGFNFGIQLTMMNIYSAEITSKNVRGVFGSVIVVSLNVGVLFQFVIGNNFSLKTTSLVTTVICVAHLILLLFLLESPYYLASRDYPAAKRNLCRLRGASSEDEVAEELNAISNRTLAKMDLSKPALKSLILCLVLAFLCDVTGRGAIIAYATQSFAADGQFSAGSFTILLGILNALFPLTSTLLTDRIGRKIIILVAATTGGIMHLLSGVLCYFHDEVKTEIPYYGWLLFFTITGFSCCATIFLTNTLLVRGELISENNRGLASGLVSTVFALSILAAIKTFQVVRDCWGLHYSFWTLGAYSFIFVFVTGVFLPETKGKTFDEIQRIFGRK